MQCVMSFTRTLPRAHLCQMSGERRCDGASVSPSVPHTHSPCEQNSPRFAKGPSLKADFLAAIATSCPTIANIDAIPTITATFSITTSNAIPTNTATSTANSSITTINAISTFTATSITTINVIPTIIATSSNTINLIPTITATSNITAINAITVASTITAISITINATHSHLHYLCLSAPTTWQWRHFSLHRQRGSLRRSLSSPPCSSSVSLLISALSRDPNSTFSYRPCLRPHSPQRTGSALPIHRPL
ncbi:unnamed protein product [Lampetra fluviatilis]